MPASTAATVVTYRPRAVRPSAEAVPVSCPCRPQVSATIDPRKMLLHLHHQGTTFSEVGERFASNYISKRLVGFAPMRALTACTTTGDGRYHPLTCTVSTKLIFSVIKKPQSKMTLLYWKTRHKSFFDLNLRPPKVPIRSTIDNSPLEGAIHRHRGGSSRVSWPRMIVCPA